MSELRANTLTNDTFYTNLLEVVSYDSAAVFLGNLLWLTGSPAGSFTHTTSIK